MKHILLLAALLAAACGPSRTVGEEFIQLTGSTQVMAAGTRSETVVFEDFLTGDRYALVGDLASELVPQYGMPVTITVVPTDEGWSMDPDLPKLELLEYTILAEDEEFYQ